MVISEAVAAGMLEAPGFFRDPMTRAAYLRTLWIGPAPGQIDELKEAKAAGERIRIGVSNEELETAQLSGQDWEAVHEQRARELRMRRAAEMDAASVADEDDADDDPDAGDLQEDAA
jgi:capsid protein